MASALLLILIIACLALMPKPNVAESSAEVYWNLKLGNETTMPKIVNNALIGSDENPTDVIKDMIRKGFPVSEELEDSIRRAASIYGYRNAFNIAKQAKVKAIKNTTITADPREYPIYFIETDLTHPGKALKLNFMKTGDGAKFLPIQAAQSIPFSSSELPRVLAIFSVNPNSTSAEIMEETIKVCETKALSDERKLCATSLEEMVDYVISNVGSNVSTFSGYVERNIQDVHRIVGAKEIEGNVSMVCHKTGYPYAVFYCHNLKETNLYEVTMSDSKGTTVNAVGICHKDTSSWNPLHVSFQILKVKPGSVPICHFLDERSIAYVRN